MSAGLFKFALNSILKVFTFHLGPRICVNSVTKQFQGVIAANAAGNVFCIRNLHTNFCNQFFAAGLLVRLLITGFRYRP